MDNNGNWQKYDEDIDLSSFNVDKTTERFEHSEISESMPKDYILLHDAVNGNLIGVQAREVIAFSTEQEKGHAPYVKVVLSNSASYRVAEDFEQVIDLLKAAM